jgi:tetratricopeptide (TPR) repeat protein
MLALAFVLSERGNDAEAQSLSEASIDLTEKVLGPDHLEEAEILSGLAVIYSEVGRCTDADRLYNRAMKIWERSLGPHSLQVAATLDRLGHLAYARGDYASAEGFHRKSLDVFQQASRARAADVSAELSNVAVVYRKEGKYSEAESLYSLAEKTCSNAGTAQCNNFGAIWNNMCLLYIDEHKYDDAEHYCQRAEELAKKTSDPHEAEILATRYGIYMAKGRYHDADSLLQLVLSKFEGLGRTRRTTNSIWVAMLLDMLGNVYAKEGKLVEAEPLYERSVKLLRASEDCSNSSDEAKVFQDYATLLRKLNKVDASELIEKQGRALSSAPNRPPFKTSNLN